MLLTTFAVGSGETLLPVFLAEFLGNFLDVGAIQVNMTFVDTRSENTFQ